VDTPSAINVRRATTHDSVAVVRLVDVLGYTITEDQTADRLEQFSRSDRDEVFVAEDAGTLQGLAVLSLVPDLVSTGWVSRITALVVSPHSRERGIAGLLIAEAEAVAAAAGSHLMQVNCGRRPEREAAHRFYRERGYSDQHTHHILYEKHL
jgi:GNAT superfamily N-acetyltransferase